VGVIEPSNVNDIDDLEDEEIINTSGTEFNSAEEPPAPVDSDTND